MSWEAFRLTSRAPSELMSVMGPAGVDGLVRDALMACWRSLPETDRTYPAWRERADKLWQRNMRVWSAISKPTPKAFFADLAPFESDGHFRQAMVLTWMMLPRGGGRVFKDTIKIIERIFRRNLAAWDADHDMFTGAVKSRAKPAASKRKPTRTALRRPKPAGRTKVKKRGKS